METRTYNASEKKILTLYALITAGTILSMLPFLLLPYAGLASISVGFLAAYIYRFKNRDNEFMVFHTTYLIRVLWWSSLILIVGIAMFACIIVFNGDLSSIDYLMMQAQQGLPPTEVEVLEMQRNFVSANRTLITIAAAFCLLPYPLFIFVKIIKALLIIRKKG